MNGLCGLLFIRQPFPVSNLGVSAGIEDYVRAEGMEYITLQPKWAAWYGLFSKYCGACASLDCRKRRRLLPRGG